MRNLKKYLQETILILGLKISTLSLKYQIFWPIELYCFLLVLIKKRSSVLNEIRVQNVSLILQRDSKKFILFDIDRIHKNLTYALGDLKDFTIAELSLRQSNFDKAIKYYTNHYKKLSSSQFYKNHVKKVPPPRRIQSLTPTNPTSLASSISNEKLVVYTVITGSYDQLCELKNQPDNITFICFTDQNIHSNFWKVIKIDSEKSPLLSSRKYKFLAHKYLQDFDASLYIDGNMHIQKDISKLIEPIKDLNFALFRHHLRDCAYEEVYAILQLGKSSPIQLIPQIESYHREGFPEYNGLFEAGIIWRKHSSQEVIGFMDNWWSEFKKYPYRDQLSFAYTAWKLNLYPNEMPNYLGNAHKSVAHTRISHAFIEHSIEIID